MSRNDGSLHDDVRVLQVLEKAWNDGCPVAKPSREFARAVVRRHRSIANRNISVTDRPGRLRDLAKGLVAYHDETASSIGALVQDYQYLADLILTELDAKR